MSSQDYRKGWNASNEMLVTRIIESLCMDCVATQNLKRRLKKIAEELRFENETEET